MAVINRGLPKPTLLLRALVLTTAGLTCVRKLERLGELLDRTGPPEVGVTVEDGVICVTATGPGAAARARAIGERLGDDVCAYGSLSLAGGIVAALRERGYSVLPSLCNFVAFDAAEDGRALFRRLLGRGVIVRPLDPYGMPRWLRVSIGTPEENTIFLEALEAASERSRT